MLKAEKILTACLPKLALLAEGCDSITSDQEKLESFTVAAGMKCFCDDMQEQIRDVYNLVNAAY